jgi:putative ABC transport system permease protein
VIFVALRLVAMLTMALARRLPRPRSTLVRLAIANIHRPGALTPSVVLSLGLGLSLLVTVIEIDGNLHRQFAAALPEKAPSFFFLDIPSADAGASTHSCANRRRTPRSSACRCCAAASSPPTESRPRISSPARDRPGCCAAIAASPTRHASAGLAPRRRAMVGADYSGAPLVSLEERTAKDLNLKLGDTITVNVLGRNVTARIANLRAVDWQNLGINFVLVFSPGTFAGAPHTDIATLTFADGGTTERKQR